MKLVATLPELLTSAAERFPNQVAIIDSKSEITYAQLFQRSQALAQTLIASGVVVGSPVGLMMPKSIDAIIAVYGIMMAGACYVPIDPFAPLERAENIANNVSLKVLVTTADKLKGFENYFSTAGEVVALIPSQPSEEVSCYAEVKAWYDSDRSASASMDEPISMPVFGGDQLAYILHTSGSTGTPKGVAITHRNALTFVDMAAEFFSVTTDDRLCSQAPLHFDLSVFDLYVACRQGSAVVIIPEFYSAFPSKMINIIQQHKVTIWNSVASALILMLERGNPEKSKLESLRLVVFSGDLMPVKYLRLLREFAANAELVNGYGQTEANTSTYYRVNEIPNDDSWRVPIGRAFPCYDVVALADDGHVVTEAGEEGELYVISNAVAQGYWNNPEVDSEKFVGDPRSNDGKMRAYRTGDNVCLDANGDFLFLGRRDNMIKSRGYRVELGDIDQALLSCAGVELAAAVAIPDAVIGNRILAFVSCATGFDLSSEEILSHCRTQLPAYMIPESVTIQAELPRTSTGKVDRQSLKKLLMD
jgi:amino acid adenylation domain-containing protein